MADMETTDGDDATPDRDATRDGAPSEVLIAAALLSAGAGAIHAAAIGSHRALPQVATAFGVLAIAQIGWALVLLATRSRPALWIGAALNGAAVGGWVLAKTTGIAFIDGFEAAEVIGTPDGFAALAAGSSAALATVGALLPATAVARLERPALRFAPLLAGVLTLALAAPAMSATADHAHGSHGVADGAGAAEADHPHHGDEASSDHPHGDAPIAAPEHHEGSHGDHTSSAVAAAPYDPELPIDLGGVEGVSLQQQARAENLVAVTLARLPRFADTATAEAAGYRSIGDEFTGHEHFINWEYLQDGVVLDPDRPESLVYERRNGVKTLVSAMFMLERGQSWDDVPDVGGALTQWHVHDDLCFTDDPAAPRVASVTSVGGSCRPPLRKLEPVPMIHVWIVPHRCGPFAALDGVGAGQVAPGESHRCDTAHGSG